MMIRRLSGARARLLLSWAGATLASACASTTDAPPAHSRSFSPQHATLDDATPATKLHWRYRVNGGQAGPLVAGSNSVTVRYDEYEISIDGDEMLQTTRAILSGEEQGSISATTRSRLSGHSPAVIVEREVDERASVTVAGQSRSLSTTEKLSFDPSEKVFFDREDLDTLDVGFSEDQMLEATLTGRATQTGSSPQSIQNAKVSITNSWSLLDQFASFEVAGKNYKSVVKVEYDSSADSDALSSSATVTSTIWFARGVGMIRSEEADDTLAVGTNEVLELVETNLVAP